MAVQKSIHPNLLVGKNVSLLKQRVKTLGPWKKFKKVKVTNANNSIAYSYN